MTEAVSSPAQGVPLIDHGVFDPIVNAAGAATMRTIAEAFWREFDNMLRPLQEAVEAGDAEGIRPAAHSLKGASANVGAGRIAAIAREIENADLETARTLLDALQAARKDTRPALEEALAEAA